jgi:hypothetical protein
MYICINIYVYRSLVQLIGGMAPGVFDDHKVKVSFYFIILLTEELMQINTYFVVLSVLHYYHDLH